MTLPRCAVRRASVVQPDTHKANQGNKTQKEPATDKKRLDDVERLLALSSAASKARLAAYLAKKHEKNALHATPAAGSDMTPEAPRTEPPKRQSPKRRSAKCEYPGGLDGWLCDVKVLLKLDKEQEKKTRARKALEAARLLQKQFQEADQTPIPISAGMIMLSEYLAKQRERQRRKDGPPRQRDMSWVLRDEAVGAAEAGF
ncbi:hypothetical protein B0A50_05184 [Salinomyces thailandicus]|uniref:Uncharacterized protein n=1 Tax=Salinomyces thailandicus TaxID=706561 RepID=A0A4U0TX24_9PEZI|nr:hypothetical protein B0A50_05184 [Salinomyces thailandica]